MKRIQLYLMLTLCAITQLATAQTSSTEGVTKLKKITSSSGIEAGMLQFAKMTNGSTTINTVPRFSYFFNTGVDCNYKFSKSFRVFSGLRIKNIGLITKYDSIKYKQRIYTLGAPLGIKFYALNNKLVLKLGADFNLAVNFKEKKFLNNEKVSKRNTYFSKETPLFVPSLFAGIMYNSVSLSAYYYPQNFFNQSYVNASGVKPYALAEANIFALCLGFNFDQEAGYSIKKPMKK